MSAAEFEDGPAQADPAKTHVAQDLAHNRPLVCCRFSPAGTHVFAGSEDETIRRWTLADGAQAELKGHESWVFALDLTPDGGTLLSGGGDGRLIWWPATAEAPAPARTVEAHNGWINHVAVSPDGGTVATSGNDGMVRLWSAADGSKVAELPGHERPVYRALFEPAGRFLLTADILGRVVQWEVATRQEVRRFDAAKLHSYNGGQMVDYGGVRDFALSPDGKLLACSGLIEASNPLGAVSNPAVVVFDWQSGAEQTLMRPKADVKGVGWGLRFLPSGSLVMASGGTGGGHLWFFKPGEANEFATFGLPNTARGLDAHPDGVRLATAHHDGHLRIESMTPAPEPAK
jgi:WD40 repeat protein